MGLRMSDIYFVCLGMTGLLFAELGEISLGLSSGFLDLCNIALSVVNCRLILFPFEGHVNCTVA